MAHIELPKPWEHLGWRINSDDNELELTLGTGITRKDLEDDDYVDIDGWPTPHTPRARALLNSSWAHVRSTETGVDVWLRLQRGSDQTTLNGGSVPTRTVTAVAYPLTLGRELTGADMRALPLQAIAAAYTRYDLEDAQRNIVAMVLRGANVRPPLDPLPPSDRSDIWLALVAKQYQEIEKQQPDKNTAAVMQEINGVESRRTVQSWITRARRKGFLPPATPKRASSPAP